MVAPGGSGGAARRLAACAVAACNDVDGRAVEFRLRPEDVCLDAVAARVSLQPFEAPARWTSSSTLRQEMHRRMLAGYSSLRSRQSYAGFEGTPGGSDEPPGVCALGNADDVDAAVGVFENPGENVWLVCAVGEADACALTVYDE